MVSPLLRAPILPLALMGGTIALVWSQRRREPRRYEPGIPIGGFPELPPPAGGISPPPADVISPPVGTPPPAGTPPAGGVAPPAGAVTPPLPSGPSGSPSALARDRYQIAVTANRPAAIQRALWAQYAAALRAENLPVPDPPPFPSSRVVLYCTKAGGCPIVAQPFGEGEVAHALEGEALGVLEAPGMGWFRVRVPAGPVLGTAPVRVGWVDAQNVGISLPRPPAPPSPPPPPPPPGEPRPGDPCIDAAGCRILPPDAISRQETNRYYELSENTVTIPSGARVDIIGSPVRVDITTGIEANGNSFTQLSPNFATGTLFYPIRYCAPDGSCLEGWMRRDSFAASSPATGQNLRLRSDTTPDLDIRLQQPGAVLRSLPIWAQRQGADVTAPPPPPVSPPSPPREPRPGDPCIAPFNCLVTASEAIDPWSQTRLPRSRLQVGGVPRGGRVDVLEGPVMVRISTDDNGASYTYTPAGFWETTTPGVETFYKIRFCHPDTSECVEGWTERRNLVPTG